MTEARFQNLNFGTKPSTAKQETVKITINPEMFRDYAEAYVAEARRINPLATEELKLTVDELFDYFKYLLHCRVQSLSIEGCKDWRIIKQYYIPTWFQFVLSQLGIVIDHARGFKFVPVYDYQDEPKRDYFETSSKIEFLSREGLVAFKDAMPRGTEGDPDTMGFVILDGFVKGRDNTQVAIGSYVAAFLGFKLSEELAYKMLFTVPYDNVEYIRDCLMHERSLYG